MSNKTLYFTIYCFYTGLEYVVELVKYAQDFVQDSYRESENCLVYYIW